jgi:hypothetical protein
MATGKSLPTISRVPKLAIGRKSPVGFIHRKIVTAGQT